MEQLTASGVRNQFSWHAVRLYILTACLAYLTGLTTLWILECMMASHNNELASCWWYRLVPMFYVGFALAYMPMLTVQLALFTATMARSGVRFVHWWTELSWSADITRVRSALAPIACLNWWRLCAMTLLMTALSMSCFSVVVVLPMSPVVPPGCRGGHIDIAESETTNLGTFSSGALSQLTLISQQRAGEGAWVTGLPLASIFDTLILVSPDQKREEHTNTFVLAGALDEHVKGPASVLRVGGMCTRTNISQPSPWPLSVADGGARATLCNGMFPGTSTFQGANHLEYLDANINVTTAYCLNYTAETGDWLSTGAHHTAGHFAFETTSRGKTDRALIYCKSSVELGTVNADGNDGTFTLFRHKALANVLDIKPPLYTAVLSLMAPLSPVFSNHSLRGRRQQQQRLKTVLAMLGFTKLPQHMGNVAQYEPPNASQLAEAIERGVLSMGAAIGQLGADSGGAMQTVTPHITAVGQRRGPWCHLYCGVLFAPWLAIAVCLTLCLFRTTLGRFLDIDAGQRFHVRWRNLFEAPAVRSQLPSYGRKLLDLLKLKRP